jgi:hypothetical protein
MEIMLELNFQWFLMRTQLHCKLASTEMKSIASLCLAVAGRGNATYSEEWPL